MNVMKKRLKIPEEAAQNPWQRRLKIPEGRLKIPEGRLEILEEAAHDP